MGVSRTLREKVLSYSTQDTDRIIRMAWEDRTTFEAIEEQFLLTPNEVVKVMRMLLDEKSFQRWRKRTTEQQRLKQGKKRPIEQSRFKCSRQRSDGSTKGCK